MGAAVLTIAADAPKAIQDQAIGTVAGALEITGYAPELIYGAYYYPPAASLSITSVTVDVLGFRQYRISVALQATGATVTVEQEETPTVNTEQLVS